MSCPPQKQGDGLRLTWERACDPATVTYAVWKVIDGRKDSIPIAGRANAGAGIVAAFSCTALPAATPEWTRAVTAPPDLVFYQARGACGDGSEGD